jgi:hypothetical protein
MTRKLLLTAAILGVCVIALVASAGAANPGSRTLVVTGGTIEGVDDLAKCTALGTANCAPNALIGMSYNPRTKVCTFTCGTKPAPPPNPGGTDTPSGS